MVVTFTGSESGTGRTDSAKITALKTNLRNAATTIVSEVGNNNKSIDGICGELRVKKLMDTIIASVAEDYETSHAITNITNTGSGLTAATLTNLPSGIKVYTAAFETDKKTVPTTEPLKPAHFAASTAPNPPTYSMNFGCATSTSDEWAVWGKLPDSKVYCIDSQQQYRNPHHRKKHRHRRIAEDLQAPGQSTLRKRRGRNRTITVPHRNKRNTARTPGGVSFIPPHTKQQTTRKTAQ